MFSIPNTFCCPAEAKKIIVIKKISDLLAYSQSEDSQLKRQFIGQGSNVLLPPKFDGCILLNQLDPFSAKIERLKHDKVLVTYPGSMSWHDCVKFSVINGFWGGENLALIPGLLSTAPVQNIGAYGVELQDLNPRIWGVDISEPQDSIKAVQKLSIKEAGFGYRESVFKRELKNKFFITQVALEFSLRPNPLLHYQDLTEYFKHQTNSPTLQKIMQAVVDIRQRKLPSPEQHPNAGSVFKNPIVSHKTFISCKNKIPDLLENEVDVGAETLFKLSAAQLIEFCGLKGFENEHGAIVSPDHSLVICNPQKVTGDKILQLMQHVQQTVLNKLGIRLMPEIEVI